MEKNSFKPANNLWFTPSDSSSSLFDKSARPRKYLSPCGTDPTSLSARRYWMYVSTIGVYWRSSCESACSCVTILSTTSFAFAGCWAGVADEIRMSARVAVRILRLCIMFSQTRDDACSVKGFLPNYQSGEDCLTIIDLIGGAMTASPPFM